MEYTDYDDLYHSAMSDYTCSNCYDYEKQREDLKEEVNYLLDLLYGNLPFSIGNIEDALDNICSHLEMKSRNGELQIEKKRKPVPAFIQNLLNYQTEILSQG